MGVCGSTCCSTGEADDCHVIRLRGLKVVKQRRLALHICQSKNIQYRADVTYNGLLVVGLSNSLRSRKGSKVLKGGKRFKCRDRSRWEWVKKNDSV